MVAIAWIYPHSGYAPNGFNFEVSAPTQATPQSKYCHAAVLDNQGKIHLVLIWDSIAGYMAVYTNGVLMGLIVMQACLFHHRQCA